MSYITQNTAWLSDDISQDVKDLVARFYELADSKSDDAGQLMASEVFSPDAVLIGPSGTFRGSKEISVSRVGAWTKVTQRRHAITKAFSGADDNQHLILLGTVHMDFVDGNGLDAAFCCHITLEAPHAEVPKPRIRFMEVYKSTSSGR